MLIHTSCTADCVRSTDGKWKVLSLMMQTGWPYAVICGTLAVAVSTFLCVNDYVPMLWEFKGSSVPGGPGTYPLGGWVSVSSFVGLMLGLVISPYCPCLNGRSGNCFIDMVSIDQSDPEKIEDGIYGIGGFLSVAKELQVLWSPPYLSRQSVGYGASSILGWMDKRVERGPFLEATMLSMVLYPCVLRCGPKVDENGSLTCLV
eukprot:Skav207041  [mRNA]  locus=scaffold975:213281:220904:- [translate_table: standard]